MKPIAAIVESNIARHAAAVDQAMARIREAEQHAEQADRRAQSAHEAIRVRRLELGRALAAARKCFPKASRNAKGWTEFLSVRRLTLEQAQDAMKYAGFVDETLAGASPDDPANLPTMRDAGIDNRPREEHGDPGAAPEVEVSEADVLAEVRTLLAKLKPAASSRVLRTVKATNVKGGSGEGDRGKWCTSKAWAVAVGPWDHDPFSNPRSLIASVTRCMLEDGGDAFGGGDPGATPGLYLTGDAHGIPPSSGIAGASTRVWIQPPFELVAEAIAHYGHTRFCALLRWSPDVKAWFPALWERTAVVCHPFGERMEFDPPPGVDKNGDMPFPHALYYADERDITDEVRARCIVWRVDHSLDCAQPTPAALHVVR